VIRAFIVMVITSVIVLAASRVRWDLGDEGEKTAMMPGGPEDMAIWAIVLGWLVFRSTVLWLERRSEM
jgi:hypothetical protein